MSDIIDTCNSVRHDYYDHCNTPALFSLWQGGPVCWSVCRSVINFLIFQKRGFESTNSNLSNTTKFILLDSLFQEITSIVRLPNPMFSTIV